MKKKILIYVLVFLTLCFSFGTIIDCKAEEVEPTIETTEEPTMEDEVVENEPTTNEPIVEEETNEVTFNEQVQDFLNTWFTPLISSIAGVLGSTLGILILKSIVKALSSKVEELANNSNVANTEAEKKLKETEEKLKVVETQLESYIGDFKTLIENQQKILSQDEKFKELIAIMFATTPELMNNGMASQVLDLLNEKEVDNNDN